MSLLAHKPSVVFLREHGTSSSVGNTTQEHRSTAESEQRAKILAAFSCKCRVVVQHKAAVIALLVPFQVGGDFWMFIELVRSQWSSGLWNSMPLYCDGQQCHTIRPTTGSRPWFASTQKWELQGRGSWGDCKELQGLREELSYHGEGGQKYRTKTHGNWALLVQLLVQQLISSGDHS